MLYNTEWEKKIDDPEIDEVGKLILLAAELIDDVGWIKGNYKNDSGFCIMGALHEASNIRKESHCNFAAAKQRVSAPLNNIGYTGDNGIAAWNDDLGRTKDEVLFMLRSVARGR